jgi:hypothetical protein
MYSEKIVSAQDLSGETRDLPRNLDLTPNMDLMEFLNQLPLPSAHNKTTIGD